MTRYPQRGFTLIEVIVAFALFGGALALLLASLSGASRQVRHVDMEGRAVLHAQSLLAGLGSETPLALGEQRGQWEQGRFQWTLKTSPYQDMQRPPATGASSLHHVQLTVSWGPGANDQLVWDTLRWAGTAP